MKKGVACEICHGRVDKMPLMRQNASLQMKWCLNCHRDPSQFIRPADKVFQMGYTLPDGVSQDSLGSALVKAYHINTRQLTNCSICHR